MKLQESSMNENDMKTKAVNVLGVLLALALALPLLVTVSMSFMSATELNKVNEIFTAQKPIGLTDLFNRTFTLRQYFILLLNRLDFLKYFWNSVVIAFPVVIGQVVFGVLGAYGFTKFDFKYRDQLFYVYILSMLMPFQVTLVPNFIIASKLGILDTYPAIWLPGIFSAFGVFFMRQFMKTIPDELIEAAKIDGAGHLKILTSIILPLAKPYVASLIVLTYIDYWNIVEQPLIMLRDKTMHPLSLILSNAAKADFEIIFASSVIYLLPPLLLFIASRDHLGSSLKSMSLK